MLVALLALAGGLQAFGDTVVFNDQSISGYTPQGFTGNLASFFQVNSPVTVDALGIFNASGTGYIAGTIQVGLYDVTTGEQVGTTVTFGPDTSYTAGGGFGHDVFQTIAPQTLAPGLYEVDAVGFSATDTNGNTGFPPEPGPVFNTLGGALNFSGYSYYNGDSSGLDFPNVNNGLGIYDTHIYEAGTLEASPVPEPSSLLLLGTGLAAFAGMLRRKLRA